MKTTVLLDELHLSDVRPDAVSLEYARLRREEAMRLVADPDVVWTERVFPAPGCTPEPVFESDGLKFQHCTDCGSIYASPIPDQACLDKLAKDGAASHLRRDYYAQRFSDRQRASIHDPLLRWASEFADEYGLEKPAIAFVGNDDTGAAAAIAGKLDATRLAKVACVSGQTGPDGVETFCADDAPQAEFDLVVDLGSLERVGDPAARFALWARLLKPEALLAFTTSNASGLEYRLLGADAPSFLALDRLNLYSIPALRTAIQAAGFVAAEISTPGRVDVELIKHALEQREKMAPMDFWRHAFTFGGQEMEADLQMFLQRRRFSSYVRVLARRAGA